MSAELINSTINIGSMLLASLIAYGFIPIPVPEEKRESWDKVLRAMKVIAPIGLLAFIIVAVLEFFAG